MTQTLNTDYIRNMNCIMRAYDEGDTHVLQCFLFLGDTHSLLGTLFNSSLSLHILQ